MMKPILVMMLFCLYLQTAQAQTAVYDDHEGIHVVDLAGRNLHFKTVPQRIILGESRYLFALSILDQKDPLRRIVGMVTNLKKIDFGSYRQYRKKFPEIDAIAQVGHTSADSFSVEKALSLNADLAIFGIDGHGPNARHAQLIDQLQSAGVKVVFIDFRNEPVVNAVKSITLLGKVLGREQRAKQYTDFYQDQLQRVSKRLSQLDAQAIELDVEQKRPDVFLHSRVGLQDLCCETMVRGMMATFIDQTNGVNIARERVPGSAGILNLEYLLMNQPEVYIATAIGASSDSTPADGDNIPPYIILGAGVDEAIAQRSFVRALNASGINELQAVKTQRAYAIWHHFYNTPLNIVAIQVFAKWLYPDEFTDLDPRHTLQVLFDRFQSVPLQGTYWLALEEPVNG
ncbi:MAG: ABC transporter substrate-binding protein [Arenicella sp.]